MKLLLDMNLSLRWVARLTQAGYEAVHWSTLGRFDAPDHEIMAFTARQGYVVVTHDLDFSAILAATHGEKPSVVKIRAEDVSPDAISGKVIVALRQMQYELDEGALITIDPSSTRERLLPLPSRVAS